MQDEMELLYQDYAKSVFQFLFNLTHDADWSEELTQETFYRAFRSLHRYDGSCKMLVWLCQIAKHVWYQEVDKRNRKQTVELVEDVPATQLSTEEIAIHAEEKEFLYKAVYTLPVPMRDVAYMRLAGDFSFAEIGRILGKNENWARVTFYRAKLIITEVCQK